MIGSALSIPPKLTYAKARNHAQQEENYGSSGPVGPAGWVAVLPPKRAANIPKKLLAPYNPAIARGPDCTAKKQRAVSRSLYPSYNASRISRPFQVFEIIKFLFAIIIIYVISDS